jgi:hypothetical protein
MAAIVLIFALMLFPFTAQAQGFGQGSRHHRPDRAADTSDARTESRRPQLDPAVRLAQEIELLTTRLSLDSAQAARVRNVLARREKALTAQRGAPIKDRDIMFIRIQKVFEDADAEISKALTDDQAMAFDAIRKERQKGMEEQRKRQDEETNKHRKGGRSGDGPGGGPPGGGMGDGDRPGD